MQKKKHLDTLCVQAGWSPKNGEPRVLPIYQSTTYKFTSADNLGELFDLKAEGHMYSRISNPTVAAVEEKITALEGGSGALCTSSGQAAALVAVLNITGAGQYIVCASAVYGGTINLFAVTLKKLGIETRFVDQKMTDAEIASHIDENTRLVFGETIANPALEVFDIERFAAIAHAHGVPLIVDNTFATPILCRPFEFGADIITHSTTKYMDGHASVVGGVVVDGGTFDWKASGKFPELCTPDESYHGVVYTDSFGGAAYITKARVQLMRDLGVTPQPLAAFILNLGLESLPLRIAKHSANAKLIADKLEKDPHVVWVNYPGLESSDQRERAEKYLPDGASGVISFGVKGGRAAAMKFLDSLELAAIVVHVADARTSALHPASTTHRQLDDAQLKACGIGPELVRLSVGIENPEDIWDDIEQALKKTEGAE